MSPEILLGIGATIISLGTLILGVSRGKHEARSLEAQATEAFAKAARDAGDDRNKLWDEIRGLKKKLERIPELESEVKALRREVADYKLYTDALVEQIRDAGKIPVTMEEVLKRHYRRKSTVV